MGEEGEGGPQIPIEVYDILSCAAKAAALDQSRSEGGGGRADSVARTDRGRGLPPAHAQRSGTLLAAAVRGGGPAVRRVPAEAQQRIRLPSGERAGSVPACQRPEKKSTSREWQLRKIHRRSSWCLTIAWIRASAGEPRHDEGSERLSRQLRISVTRLGCCLGNLTNPRDGEDWHRLSGFSGRSSDPLIRLEKPVRKTGRKKFPQDSAIKGNPGRKARLHVITVTCLECRLGSEESLDCAMMCDSERPYGFNIREGLGKEVKDVLFAT
ncbi:uncharacterized protein LOC116959514 [Tyto alba]|uniref:uncharacterized protein LOC116959514 n=1 Tax=Tyto alba TaxID=56313 RepID=UPI001C665BC2|nr:uncharacterized protein LOC116959514 [Tyto alba]